MSQSECLTLPPSPPSSVKMDPTFAEGSCENSSSPPTRSGAGNRFSISRDQYIANIDISTSPRSLPVEVERPLTSSPHNYPSNVYLSPPTAQSAYLPTSSSQPYSSFPVLSPTILNSTWSQSGHISEQTPSFHLGTGNPSHPLSSRPRNIENPSRMNAVALQLDPSFSMGSRSAFTWPGPIDSSTPGNAMLGHDLSSIGHGSDPSLTPPTGARSLTSSPPRISLTTEQRELKRQQDRARRDSRFATRMRRESSQSYVESSPGPLMSDGANNMNLPVYTTAPASMSLLAEPATSMSTPSYLPSYSTSMDDQHQAHAHHQVYPTGYPQNLQPNYSIPMEYPNVYAEPGHYSTRPTSIPVGQDVGLMYQVPAVMTSGGAGAQEGGHVRVVQSRPKPRCWEHGCNGRQFSTFSNLLRHQREKSGQAAKATCPNCGAEFTRTTARNGHLLHDKCKGRRNN